MDAEKYLNSAIRHKTFDKAISTILSKEEEERCWSLYLSLMMNPFAERMSFDDFMAKHSVKAPVHEKIKQQKQVDVRLEVRKADALLRGFKPDRRRRGGARGGNRGI